MQRSENREATGARLDRIEREMLRSDSLEMAAVRRLLHGLSETDGEADPIGKVDAIVERIEALETEVSSLRAQLRAQQTHQNGTKKQRAKRLARNEVLRQIEQGTNPIGEGGAVDVPTVITMGRGLGIEFTHKTVGDAFGALATEWDAFELQEGSGTKEGANKRLVALNDSVPEVLWQAYDSEISPEVIQGDTVVESSDRRNGGD